MRFVQDVQPVHGNFLLQCGRYRYSTHEKRAVAQDVCDHFVAIVTDIYSGEDIDKWIDAHEAGQKKPAPSKGSTRQKEKNGKITEAKSEVESVLNKLVKGTPPDLLDDLVNILKDDLDSYWSAFKRSKYLEQYAKARQMEEGTTVQDDYHQFRVLGVGGFGAVHAAVKRDTGLLCAIKRMDKKLIKHKNRYKSCYTEIECLKEMASPYVCGMHYSFQTKEDVCLVLDLLHGGTLSYLLHQKKKVKEKDVCFFTACITLAYQALHTKGYVYRDMKPANVLIKDNGYAVLIDFGLAAKVSTVLKGKCGTRGYWSPEMVKVRAAPAQPLASRRPPRCWSLRDGKVVRMVVLRAHGRARGPRLEYGTGTAPWSITAVAEVAAADAARGDGCSAAARVQRAATWRRSTALNRTMAAAAALSSAFAQLAPRASLSMHVRCTDRPHVPSPRPAAF